MTGRPIPNAPDQYEREHLQEILTVIEARLRHLETAAGRERYAVTNLTTSRSLDALAANASEVRAFLATLAQDLKSKGVIS